MPTTEGISFTFCLNSDLFVDLACASEYIFQGGTFYHRTFRRAPRRVSRVCAEALYQAWRAFYPILDREHSNFSGVGSPLFCAEEAFFTLSATTKTSQVQHISCQVCARRQNKPLTESITTTSTSCTFHTYVCLRHTP